MYNPSEYNKKYYRENKEKILSYRSKYKKNFRYTVRGRLYWLLEGVRRRNKKSDLTVDYLYVLHMKQKGLCALTGIGMTISPSINSTPALTAMSIDRKIAIKGYKKGNIQLVTFQANIAKSHGTNKQFYRMCEAAMRNKK